MDVRNSRTELKESDSYTVDQECVGSVTDLPPELMVNSVPFPAIQKEAT